MQPEELTDGLVWLDRHFVIIGLYDDPAALSQPSLEYILEKARMAVLRCVAGASSKAIPHGDVCGCRDLGSFARPGCSEDGLMQALAFEAGVCSYLHHW